MCAYISEWLLLLLLLLKQKLCDQEFYLKNQDFEFLAEYMHELLQQKNTTWQNVS